MKYYFYIDGKNVGPLDEDEIKKMISNGKIKLETLAWKEGSKEWLYVKDLPLLVSLFHECVGSNSVLPPRFQKGGNNIYSYSSESCTAKESYADFMPRFLAGLIDAFILFIPSIAVNIFIPLLGGFIVCIPYYLYFMSNYGGGQSVGYKAMKLKLVDQDTNQPIPVVPVFLWYIVLSFVGFIGWIWFFTDKKRRMLHNIASRTVVLDVR